MQKQVADSTSIARFWMPLCDATLTGQSNSVASHTNLARKRVTEYISQSAIGTMSLQDMTGNAGVALSLPL
ncbi:hypothetical protein [Cupriavidus sp. SW-Y-13]|uniref:hypothetical protein n=1 Tax=Cupriavidus sp. SW-Y-13 TaxID=2653854 RepID=UPI001365F4FC|nr:hypothetical protein [Cupriavidus sp. SW-Y-13]MWL89663.1 hypothetical protein [Cupriavidus sp. SW-Y-13]